MHLVTVGRKCATSPTMKEKVSKASVATLEGKFLSLFEFGLLFGNTWLFSTIEDSMSLVAKVQIRPTLGFCD